MTKFNKSVSWSKFDMALRCPMKLQKTIDKEYSPKFGSTTRAAMMGTLVQKVFELYFNNDFNLKAGGRSGEVLHKILVKTLASKWASDGGFDSSFLDEAALQLVSGLKTLEEMGKLHLQTRSEVKMQVQFNGFRMFGMLDFVTAGEGGSYLYDGKGNSREDADPNQIKYYALTLHAAGTKLLGGGFIYWKHGYREVDITAKGLHEFVHGDFARGRKVFARLAAGVDYLEANPTSKNCHYCNWRATCKESYYKKDSGPVLIGVNEVGF